MFLLRIGIGCGNPDDWRKVHIELGDMPRDETIFCIFRQIEVSR